MAAAFGAMKTYWFTRLTAEKMARHAGPNSIGATTITTATTVTTVPGATPRARIKESRRKRNDFGQKRNVLHGKPLS
jgi:hypothetical protein